jgi:DNA-binding response OmpR family regulator
MTAINPKALLVGVHDSETSLIENYVNKSNYIAECYRAKTNQEAIEFLAENEFEIIIINSMLEDADVRDLIKYIRKTLNLNIPILVISNIPGDKFYIDCISLDAEGYLFLPLDFYKLKNEIERILFLKANIESIKNGQKLYQDNKDSYFDQVLKDKNILIVDDDYYLQQLTKDILTSKGVNVDTANNGEEAIYALKSNEYSCVLLDIQMPIMNGFQALEKIRGNPKYWNLPIIILSSLGQEEDILKGYQLGANDYLLKPINETALTARIKSLLL